MLGTLNFYCLITYYECVCVRETISVCTVFSVHRKDLYNQSSFMCECTRPIKSDSDSNEFVAKLRVR